MPARKGATMIVLAEETPISVIQAIGELWKLGLVVAGGLFIIVAMILFRKQIRGLLERMQTLTLKRGQTEVSVESGSRPLEPKSGEVPAGEAGEKKDEETGKETGVMVSGPTEPGDSVRRMCVAFLEEKFDEAESAYKETQAAEKDEVERLRNTAWYLYLQYKYKHEVAVLDELEKLARNAKAKPFAMLQIGMCHKYARSYPQAIKALRESLIGEPTDFERASRLRYLATCLSESGQRAEALKELETGLRQVLENKAKAGLYMAIAEVHQAEGNKMMWAIALQKALQYSPDEIELLSSAAWAEGEAEMPLLAVLNYGTLLRFKPKAAGELNNLGVQCERLGLPIMGGSYYRKAGNEKETVALANIAYRCINAGLEKEARDAIQEAMQEKQPHKNVGLAKASLEEKMESELKAWNEFASMSIKQQLFIWEYAERYFIRDGTSTSFAGQWVSPDGNVFEVRSDGDEVSGVWEKEDKGEKFHGSVRGRSMQLEFKRKQGQGFLTTGKGYWGNKQAGIGYLGDDERGIFIQVGTGKDVFFLSLVRKE
jgi:tetratricopeptide (TPR) repeat protein